jgi:hypothetical protein
VLTLMEATQFFSSDFAAGRGFLRLVDRTRKAD